MDYNFGYNYLEDRDKLNQLLTDFNNPQVKAYIKNAGYSININDYEKDNDLFQIVNECYYKKLEEIEAGNLDIIINKRKIYEDEFWLVVTPKLHEEAVTLGRGTYWCTSADSEDGKERFEQYTIDDFNNFHDLYIFIDKQNKDNKYQWSELQEIFLNQDDKEFNIHTTFDLLFIENFYLSNNLMPYEFKEILGRKYKEKYYNLFIETLPESNKIIEIRNNELNLIKILLNLGFKNTYGVKEELINNGYGWDLFINDPNEDMSELVASKGYGLDILVNDESWFVRKQVAIQGYGLDILINDNDYNVRQSVFENNYGLNILLNDENNYIREITLDKLNYLKEKYGNIIPTKINQYGFECYLN